MSALSQVDLFNLLFIFSYFTVCTVFVVWSIRRELQETAQVIAHHTEIVQSEVAEKRALLEELAVRTLYLADPEEFLEARKDSDAALLATSQERAKIAAIDEEIAGIKNRLEELAAVDKQLETSSEELGREQEAFEGEEGRLGERTKELTDRLQNAPSLIEAIQAAAPSGAGELGTLSERVLQIGEKLEAFHRESREILQKYLTLKRSYDALNIEYTQLYEKQSLSE
jgi:methyl-accepting chemotaxis protein